MWLGSCGSEVRPDPAPHELHGEEGGLPRPGPPGAAGPGGTRLLGATQHCGAGGRSEVILLQCRMWLKII